VLTGRPKATPSSNGAAEVSVVLDRLRVTAVQEINDADLCAVCGSAAQPNQTAWDGRGFVAVVGPPAVGKSTVSGALTDRLGGRVFRLREFAYDYRRRPWVDERLFDTTDSLGWFGEHAVAVLLDARLPSRTVPSL
jgi:hypothetical protein